MGKRKKRYVLTKPPPQKADSEYQRLWKIVDGAVADAFTHHKNYLHPTVSVRVVRTSINKRVVGAIGASLREQRGASGNTG